jgi:hypothetical protein
VKVATTVPDARVEAAGLRPRCDTGGSTSIEPVWATGATRRALVTALPYRRPLCRAPGTLTEYHPTLAVATRKLYAPLVLVVVRRSGRQARPTVFTRSVTSRLNRVDSRPDTTNCSFAMGCGWDTRMLAVVRVAALAGGAAKVPVRTRAETDSRRAGARRVVIVRK